MRSYLKYILSAILIFSFIGVQPTKAAEENAGAEKLNVGQLVLDHLADAYEWHFFSTDTKHYAMPLPIILYEEGTGLKMFSSSNFEHGAKAYDGYYIASEGDYRGKILKKNSAGEEIRPWDFSITKNVVGLFLSAIVAIGLIMYVASWHKKQDKKENYKAPKGLVGFIEMFIMSIMDDVIIPCIGKNYRKFSPYLLTAFFFIFITNLLGLIPSIVPGFGANVTGNIAVTLVLGLCTFFIVNITGTREYWREVFWPDVPMFLKVIPIMPLVEIIGLFTKPFSLIIRLFANILAGHSIILGLTCLIFVTAGMGAALNGSMTVLSVILSVFMMFVEILVAYIQAYVFTMLSAVYIGMAQAQPVKVK